jgi:glycosyltransferase involved in cell wall biosynthesis
MKVAFLTTDARECYLERWKTEPYFGAPQEALFYAIPQFPEVEFHVISCWQKPMTGPAKLASNIWFHGLHVPQPGWLRTGYQGCIRAVRRKLREIKPDIAHGQGTERDCAIAAVFSGLPNVITIHGNMAKLARLDRARIGSYLWCSARLENFTLKRSDGVFCNSAYTESLVRPRARRTWRVANPIREPFFSRPLAPPPAPCVLLNVGAISPRKRQVELIELGRQLHQAGLAFEFRFIGRADANEAYGAAFLERIQQAEREGFARYLGCKLGDELIDSFDQASALVHFPNEEAFGLVVVEGMARGLKLFGARLGGIMEIAAGVEGAELFAENDWNGLKAALQAWMQAGHPKNTPAATVMRQRYHPEVIARQHLEIYRAVLRTDS